MLVPYGELRSSLAAAARRAGRQREGKRGGLRAQPSPKHSKAQRRGKKKRERESPKHEGLSVLVVLGWGMKEACMKD